MSFAAHAALDALLEDLKLSRQQAGAEVEFIDDDPIVASRFRPAAASAAALAAEAVGIAAIWRHRTGRGQTLRVDLRRACVPGLRTSSHLSQSRHQLVAGRPTQEEANFFPTRDGQKIYVLRSANYASKLIGLLGLLKCANDSASLAEAISRWDSNDLEEALAERKLVGVVARGREAWLAHPQGQWLLTQAPAQLERISEAPPRVLPQGPRPLSGLRVLDMAHVLAGPTCARLLAEQGADVLQVCRPLRPDDIRTILDTGIGKRSAFIDLDAPQDTERLQGLIAEADVFVHSFRPGSLDDRGLSPDAVAKINPGIVYASVSAYGAGGPWRRRGGYELVGQAVAGLAYAEGSFEAPIVAPTFTLNDYLCGYLAAAGVTAALARQLTEGGGFRVQTSLARASMWVQDIGALPQALWPDRSGNGTSLPKPRDSDFMETDSAYGLIRHPKPIVAFSETTARWDRPPAPPGSSSPLWLQP